jgi:predicted Zn-dependent protease
MNNYSYYLALRKEKLDRAEELSSRLFKKFPGNGTYADTYAWVLFAREKFREAAKVLEPVIQGGNASGTHLEHYGDILFRLGETDKAVKQWELALSLNSRNEPLRKKILNRKLN